MDDGIGEMVEQGIEAVSLPLQSPLPFAPVGDVPADPDDFRVALRSLDADGGKFVRNRRPGLRRERNLDVFAARLPYLRDRPFPLPSLWHEDLL
ncbi:MAG: hypothetical protein ABEN55_24215, partial [Bradymonadaceae bacterium]